MSRIAAQAEHDCFDMEVYKDQQADVSAVRRLTREAICDAACRAAVDLNARAIIAITSTHTKNGKTMSRIKPLITEGSSVTATREFTDYVITEYGIARLRGLSLRDRAEELIRISHPDFRNELRASLERK